MSGRRLEPLNPGKGAGPAAAFAAVQADFGYLAFMVEDLGIITDDVRKLRDLFAVPGTRVLHFAVDRHADNLTFR